VKLLVTGANGQLGRALVRLGAAGRTRAELDVGDASAVAAALDAEKPDVVVNAAAYTAVDRAESEPDAAFAANEAGARAVAAACAARGIALVHVSTDYVFDGEKPTAYVETDATRPLGAYGASKAAGERAVLAAHPGALVVRSSWVFSADGSNFVKTMLRLARETPALRVVADQHGCPTFAGDLARIVLELAERRAPAGIYHAAGDGPTTWHGFAAAIVDEAAKAGRAPRVPVEPIKTDDYPTAARRPRNSILDTAKLRALGIVPALWIDGLRAVVQAT